jgi:tetratricopeptide (TPR) repeat protein
VSGPERDLWAQRLRAGRDARYWATNTRLMLRDAQTYRGRELQAKLRDFAYWCEVSVARPEIIDADIFAEFVEQFSRVAGNYGAVEGADVERALDKVIGLQQRRSQPTTRLWLAKARFRSMISLEDRERERALDAAMSSAVIGTELWAEAILGYTWYLIDVSRYDRALRIAARLQHELPADLFARKYRCGYHTMAGVALFTSFRDLRSARAHMLQACSYEEAGRTDQQILRWVATAHHYLGRIAEVDKRYREALTHYVHGQGMQEKCPEELQSLAFLHLRLSEPLIAMGTLDQAEDHLHLALQQFADSAEHSSGRLQAQLGFATLCAARGDLDNAMRAVEDTRQQARQIGFWRGELLCLGYRLSLLIRARRFGRIPDTLIDILKTIRGGELGHNNAVRLLLRVPVVLAVAVRRMAHRTEQESVTGEADRCPCPMHCKAPRAPLRWRVDRRG